ncbi:hypothetical protein C5167_024882, partial [Papaver somniferum]
YDDISPITENIIFSKYEIGRLLGCSAFTKIYHARNIQTGQTVAIKAISKQKIINGGLMTNIKREISIMRQLHHPYMSNCSKCWQQQQRYALVFVKGSELLAKLLSFSWCFPHLKPENLLLEDKGDLKASYFGLSAKTSQVQNEGLLHTLCRTSACVASKILAKKGYNGAKIDIWSCGVILITVDETIQGPWFLKGYKEIKFHEHDNNNLSRGID